MVFTALKRCSMRRIFLIMFTFSFAIAPWGLGGAVEQSRVIPDSLLHDSSAQELKEVIQGASYVDEKKGAVFRGHREVYEYLLNHLTRRPPRRGDGPASRWSMLTTKNG
jgi:hypothetical protein